MAHQDRDALLPARSLDASAHGAFRGNASSEELVELNRRTPPKVPRIRGLSITLQSVLRVHMDTLSAACRTGPCGVRRDVNPTSDS